MTLHFPNESVGYRAARNTLLDAEIELRRSMESVAAARRALPEGGLVPDDYVFQGALGDHSTGDISMSQLFSPGKSSLAIYNFMFPRNPSDTRAGPASGETAELPLDESPCPSCVALLDQLDGAAPHLSPLMTFAVVAKTPIERLRVFGRERGWKHLLLLSSARNSFNADYGGETGGFQQPMFNVFTMRDGTIRHFWGAELLYAPMDPGQDMRHVGTLEPMWNMLDFMPEGRRANWDEQLHYSCCH